VGHVEYNVILNNKRISVEWGFGYVMKLFSLLNNLDALSLSTRAPGQLYEVATFLANDVICIKENQVSNFFDLLPPSLEEHVDYL
jgi:hypothetical protein